MDSAGPRISAEDRAPALAAEKDLREKKNCRNGEPTSILRCQQAPKNSAVDARGTRKTS
jgi:hypothetical protein